MRLQFSSAEYSKFPVENFIRELLINNTDELIFVCCRVFRKKTSERIHLHVDDGEGDGVVAMEEFTTVEIDLLFDIATLKLTGTILLKPTWLYEKDYLPPMEFRKYGGICFKFKDMNHKGVFSV